MADGEPPADLRGRLSWALFEFARSPYLSLIFVFVFGPYFANHVVGDPVRGQELWGLANTAVGVVIAMLAPVLGAVCDRMGRRKTWIAAMVAIMVPACFSLWYAYPGASGGLPVVAILAAVAILVACFMFSEMFHNAMLPSLVGPERIGRLSGLGISVGNAGSLVALVIMLFGIALPASGLVRWSFLPDAPLFGLDPSRHEHDRIAGPLAGTWLLLFSLPLMFWTPDRRPSGLTLRRAVTEGLAQIRTTVQRARQMRNIGLYLLARMFYNDGKVAILAYTGIYASGTFGWGLVEVLLFALLLTPFSITGGLVGGWLDDRLGSRRAILISIGGTFVGMIIAVSCNARGVLFFVPYSVATDGPIWDLPYFRTLPEAVYIVTFMFLAATVTAAFSSSRSMMARIAPRSMMSQFFGLYAVSGNATAFLGHGTVTFFTAAFQSQAAGYASVVILLLTGLVLMVWVREERAAELA